MVAETSPLAQQNSGGTHTAGNRLMDSTVARMSSMTFLPLLALLVAANTAVGFIAPSLHVGSMQRAVSSVRCRVTGKAGLRGGVGRRSVGLSMEVEPHVLRLQAAELGSRLRVRSEP